MLKKFALAAIAILFVAGLCAAAGSTGHAILSKAPRQIKLAPAPDRNHNVNPIRHDPKAWQLTEGFEGSWLPTGWSLAGGASLWSQYACSGYGVGAYSARANFYSVSSGSQDLITLTFTATAADDSLKFDHAYATYVTENDQLQISTSTNGGSTWAVLITLDGGVSGPLVTAPPQTGIFVPTAGQWATKRYLLPVGTNAVKFTAITAYGNQLYLDNVAVGRDYVPVAGDLAMESIDEPSAAFIEPGLPFAPAVTVNNPGTSPVTDFQVIFQADDGAKALVYSDTVFVVDPDTLFPDSSHQYTFADFTPLAYTEYNITAYVSAAGDPYNGNDTLHYFFRTWDLDVGTAAIVAPIGNVLPVASVDPQTTCHNYAAEAADFDAYFEIYDAGASLIYGESVNITGLAAGADTTVTFPTWAGPHAEGAYTTQAYTVMNYDLDASNDTLAGGFTVSNAIWNQYEAVGGTGALAAQNFEAANDAYDCWLGDDFYVSGVDSVTIDSMIIGGAYWNGTGLADSVFMAISTDSSGFPAFSQVVLQQNIIAPNFVDDGVGNFEVNLNFTKAPITLLPGMYWLIFDACMDFTAGGQWGWESRTVVGGTNECKWFNPGGGFAVGTNWVTASTVWGAYDVRFALFGESFITGVEGKPTQVTKSSEFSLLPNYPNPVRGRTTMSFNLPKASSYSLKVYNIAGQLVHNASGAGRAGLNNVEWNTGRTGNGVYFYTLSAGGQQATRKLIIVK